MPKFAAGILFTAVMFFSGLVFADNIPVLRSVQIDKFIKDNVKLFPDCKPDKDIKVTSLSTVGYFTCTDMDGNTGKIFHVTAWVKCTRSKQKSNLVFKFPLSLYFDSKLNFSMDPSETVCSKDE